MKLLVKLLNRKYQESGVKGKSAASSAPHRSRHKFSIYLLFISRSSIVSRCSGLLIDVCCMVDLNSTASVGKEMTNYCKFLLTALVVLVVAQTSVAAVLPRDPPIGACLCTSDINGLVTSKRGK